VYVTCGSVTQQVTLFDWAFDPSSPLHRDLASISSAKSDLIAVLLRIHFPTDFPCVLPLLARASRRAALPDY